MDKPGFLELFNSIADHLIGHEQQVAFQLLRHWSKDGRIFPGVTTLSKRTGLHRTSVMKAIHQLEAREAVRVTRVVGRPNVYELTGTVKPVCPSDQSLPATSRPERLHQSLPATTPVAPSDPKKPRKRSKKKSISTKPDSHPHSHELKLHYVNEFKARRGTEPAFAASQWSRAMKAFGQLADAAGPEKAKHAITNALSVPVTPTFTPRVQPWELVADLNKHLGAKQATLNRGPYRQSGAEFVTTNRSEVF